MSDQLEHVEQYAQEPQEHVQTVEETPRQETQKEINHRILRERAEAAERRAAELEYQLQMQQTPKQQKHVDEDDDDEDFDISDDSFVEGHQVKKYLKKINQKVVQAKKQFEEVTKKTAAKYAETNLKTQFADFDNVVTKENLEKLKQTKAPLYRSIMANTDLYDMGYSAYEAIRAMGISNNEYEDLDKRIETNRQKPRASGGASAQVGETPLSRMGNYDRRVLTEEDRARIRRNVEQAKMNR